MPKLGVNIDHVATIRQARGVSYPAPIEAALLAQRAGADRITVHLREDRRHIQDADLPLIKRAISVPLNLEMAACDEIVGIACSLKPATATLVPEKRMELTTEGGLDVAANFNSLVPVIKRLSSADIQVSLFVDPEENQLKASLESGASAIELHTGRFCDSTDAARAEHELMRLKCAARLAHEMKFKVCAGHGLNYENAAHVAKALPWVMEYNIGHSIIARAVMVGIEQAVREMKEILENVRQCVGSLVNH